MMTLIKLSTVLIVGFSLGFLFGLIILDSSKKKLSLSLKRSSLIASNCDGKYGRESYEMWLDKQGARIVPVNIDEYFHGSKEKHTTLESKWLKKRAHVTCVVFVEREKNVQAARLTWLNHCNSYSLFHAIKPHVPRSQFLSTLGVTNLESTSSWHFLCNVIRHLWQEKNKEIQWVIFVSDDMFVIPENLRYIVTSLNYNEPYYLGHARSLWGQAYNEASAGYVLSKASLYLLATNFTSSKSCQEGGRYWKKEDFYLGQNLRKLNIFPGDTRDTSCRGRFHGYNLNQLLLENKLASIAPYWRNSLFPSSQGKNCCSESSVTFQGIEADKIYMYDYIINHLNIYSDGVFGNRPASTPYPPEKVWEKFLVEQGYTNVKNVTAEEYLKAWKNKIGKDFSLGKFKPKKVKSHNIMVKGEDGHGEVYAVPFEIDDILG